MGKSCRKILRENLVGNLGEILWENLAVHSCGKILWEILCENLPVHSCGEILQKMEGGKSQFKKGSDWWKFSNWNRVMRSQPIRIQLGKILRENLAGKSCGKILWENLARNLVGKSCRKFLPEMEEGKKSI